MVPQKRAGDPRPPHTRQEYEQKSGQNMTQNASKQGKLDSFGAIFLFIVLPCMWGLGLPNDSPVPAALGRRASYKAPCSYQIGQDFALFVECRSRVRTTHICFASVRDTETIKKNAFLEGGVGHGQRGKNVPKRCFSWETS